MNSVCIVHKDLGTIDRGGVCVLFKTMAKALLDNGWKVSCITTQPFTMDGVSVYKIAPSHNPYNYSKQVTKAIETIRPDIAECSNWKFELLNYSQKTNRKTKVVVRCDPTATTLFPKRTDLREGEKKLCRQADLLLAVSKFAMQDVKKKYKVGRVRLVYNGISAVNPKELKKRYIRSGKLLPMVKNSFCKINKKKIDKLATKNKINIFWVGKTTKMKGFDYLEKIVSVAPENFNFILNLGHAPQEVKWKEKNYKKCLFIQDLSKKDQLNLWSKCDVFLSTSRVEGFGLAVAEALSLGLPVILNKKCQAFQEFLPNPAISLVAARNPKETIRTIIKVCGSKVNYSRNPKIFTDKVMVKETIKNYLSLL